MRSMRISSMVLAAVGLAVVFSGCGSNLNSSDDKSSVRENFGTDGAGRSLVGADRCVGCHEGFSWSAELVADYLAGKHVIHSDHIEAASDSTCLACHDPVGDGTTLESLIASANVPAGGLAAVTCEACHGAGGEHYGVGPMPVPSPDYTVCGACHAQIPENHLAFHPEAANIAADYAASAHAASGNHNETRCAKCHTDEGGRAYKDVQSAGALEAALPVVADASPVQCRTCHDPHNPGVLLREGETSRSGAVTSSAEYNTCTNCHQEHDAELDDSGDLTSTSDGDSGDLIYHARRYSRVIAANHYDDPATPAAIEGFVMNPASERVCRDCHNVHSADVTIQGEWARSAHGGHIAEVKEAAAATKTDRTLAQTLAVQAAFTNDATGAPGWAHYDWDAADRQDCQRCHTATGSKNFLTDPATYDAANNDFSHLEGWKNSAGTITSSGQNEMLFCWACHTNNSGALRDPGAITEVYDPAVVVSYPDVSSSNICMSCHLGRETGAVIKTTVDADGVRGFINSHYLSAGAQLFAESGYEYAGRNYANVTSFVHDQIGMPTQPATGDGGPCVGCHMSATESHLFLPVETDEATDRITAVTATVCGTASCHPGLAGSEVQTWKHEYEGSLGVLQAALEARGIFFLPSYPYFFNDHNGDGVVPTPGYTFDHDGDAETDPIAEDDRGNGFTNWAGPYGLDNWRNTMGAAFNYNLLEHDPGGYAHNDFYVKGLIWDSIDFIYNGVLDNDVPAALNNLVLDAATRAAALDYLDSARPGDANRPPLP